MQQHNNRKKRSLKRRLQNIYTEIDAKLHLQNVADKLKWKKLKGRKYVQR